MTSGASGQATQTCSAWRRGDVPGKTGLHSRLLPRAVDSLSPSISVGNQYVVVVLFCLLSTGPDFEFSSEGKKSLVSDQDKV